MKKPNGACSKYDNKSSKHCHVMSRNEKAVQAMNLSSKQISSFYRLYVIVSNTADLLK